MPWRIGGIVSRRTDDNTTFPALESLKIMAEERPKSPKVRVSDDLFGVGSNSAHPVVRFPVRFRVVGREFNRTGKSRDVEAPST